MEFLELTQINTHPMIIFILVQVLTISTLISSAIKFWSLLKPLSEYLDMNVAQKKQISKKKMGQITIHFFTLVMLLYVILMLILHWEWIVQTMITSTSDSGEDMQIEVIVTAFSITLTQIIPASLVSAIVTFGVRVIEAKRLKK